MDFKTNDFIQDEIIAKINEYHTKHKHSPTNITLGTTQYRDLWLFTFYNYTRKITEPHTLTDFMGCKLIIAYKEDIICS